MSTTIEWTDQVWNPSTGCDRISAGCDNCYALTMAKRLKGMRSAKYQTDGNPITSGPGFGVAIHPDTLDAPLSWRKPRRVFVNSMSDLFHARVPVEFVGRVWATMRRADRHTFQILTKRPERMARIIGDAFGGGQSLIQALDNEDDAQVLCEVWPLPNVLLGTSIESDEHVGRADHLRKVDAAVRFLSLEPLLGPLPSLNLDGIGWVIAGAESGPGARPMNEQWVRDIKDRCVDLGIPFFYKQDALNGTKLPLPELDGQVWAQMPAAVSA
jgi:protein gp37